MFLSVFDIFKIGIGPSSSHTMGPMTAAAAFLHSLRQLQADPGSVTRIDATLYGSLAFTGKGHATDRAVILGLMGFEAHSLDMARAEQSLADLHARKADCATRPAGNILRPGDQCGLRLWPAAGPASQRYEG